MCCLGVSLTPLPSLASFFHQRLPQSRNIHASLGSDASEDDISAATGSLNTALALSLVFFTVEFVGIFAGFTLLMQQYGALSSLLFRAFAVLLISDPRTPHPRCLRTDFLIHFLGAVLVSWYVADGWGWDNYWYLFGFLKYVLLSAMFPLITQCSPSTLLSPPPLAVAPQLSWKSGR
jgi:Transmembrane protein